MNVGLIDFDKTGFPNLALMKLSAALKGAGHDVSWYEDGAKFSKVFGSSVFSYTDTSGAPEGAVIGGYGRPMELPEGVEHSCPDYSLYGLDYSMGFLTRGCPRKCPWCVVPQKEGGIRANAPYTEFVRHKKAVFLDNNVLAHTHGIDQIDRLSGSGVKVDFNQGLDARLIDDGVARRLSKLKWLAPVRLACDHKAMMKDVFRAITLLRWHNTIPQRYSVYVLVTDIEDALYRVKLLNGMGVDSFCQPYRAPDGTPPTREQRRFARWVNTKALFRAHTWESYQEWRGDRI